MSKLYHQIFEINLDIKEMGDIFSQVMGIILNIVTGYTTRPFI